MDLSCSSGYQIDEEGHPFEDWRPLGHPFESWRSLGQPSVGTEGQPSSDEEGHPTPNHTPHISPRDDCQPKLVCHPKLAACQPKSAACQPKSAACQPKPAACQPKPVCQPPPCSYDIYHNLVSHIDLALESNIDFVQEQLNMISQSYRDIYQSFLTLNQEQEKIIQQIKETREHLTEVENRPVECPCPSKQVMITDPTKPTLWQPPCNETKMLFVTMVGGGGAGGVGIASNFYFYGGGGGGAGACLIKKPIELRPGAMVYVSVGKGGTSSPNGYCHGGETIIEIRYNGITEIRLVVAGGANGSPTKDSSGVGISTNGGIGGSSATVSIFAGANGENGTVSIPSQAFAQSGSGGASALASGGRGGGNYISPGGNGGNESDICGQDGNYGSGGGGSCPRHNLDGVIKLSGNGGNGMVLIEF